MGKEKFDFASPVLVELNDMAEVVYADTTGSGYTPREPEGDKDDSLVTSDCWTASCPLVQDWNGSGSVYEVHVAHSKGVSHITGELTLELNFSGALGSNGCLSDGGVTVEDMNNYSVSQNGNIATIKRYLHANGYKSGDTVTFKVFAKGNLAKPLTNAVTITPYCRHDMNVQGVND